MDHVFPWNKQKIKPDNHNHGLISFALCGSMLSRFRYDPLVRLGPLRVHGKKKNCVVKMGFSNQQALSKNSLRKCHY